MPFERPDIIRPPSEGSSYFLPLTAGCSNNSCGFCNYFGSKLKIREIDEVKQEIDALALFRKHQLRLPHIPFVVYAIASEWDGKRIFLQDGDALAFPYSQLKEVLEYLNHQFPDIERIASYGTPQDILRLNVEDLKTLRKLKLGIVYMGVESGDDSILRKIGKGVNSRQIIEAGRKIKEAGILLSVTVLLGLGGAELSHDHALATARVLTALDADFVGALTLTLIPGTPMHEEYQKGKLALISPMQSLQELRTIIENVTLSNCFFSSMHASNYLSVRGRLPQDKAEMLSRLDYVLSRGDRNLLRPEYMRGL